MGNPIGYHRNLQRFIGLLYSEASNKPPVPVIKRSVVIRAGKRAAVAGVFSRKAGLLFDRLMREGRHG